ncbi:MAG: hypothetical protein JW904_09835 [Spirochaetales bacterium]|nr:hypothetical protein [Spirochaetales bacterium]
MLEKEDFFFNDNEKNLFFLVIKIGAAVVLGIVLVSILVIILVPRPSSAPAEVIPSGEEERRLQDQLSGKNTEPELTNSRRSVIKRLELFSFVIPEAEQQSLEPSFYLFRTPLPRWDDLLVSRFWIDPNEIGIDTLSKENDKNIRELFDGIQ